MSEVVNDLIKILLSTNGPWEAISDELYRMFEQAWKPSIEVQGYQNAVAGASVKTPSPCRLPGGQSLIINLYVQ